MLRDLIERGSVRDLLDDANLCDLGFHYVTYDLRGSVAAGRCPECGVPIRYPQYILPVAGPRGA